jgi:hypothetical protein
MAKGKKTGGRDFTKNDPRINRNGRRKNGETIADAFRALLTEETNVTRKVKGRAVEERILRLRLFAETMFNRAISGSDAAARLIANYVDGPFTGRLGALPPEGPEEEADDEIIMEHLEELILAKRNGNGNKK